VGAVWSSTHTKHLHQMAGVDIAVSYPGSIVSWPVLPYAEVCMTWTRETHWKSGIIASPTPA
jgi:hypothetical protein